MRILRAGGVHPATALSDVLVKARSPEHRVAITLMSALKTEGKALPQPLAAEVDFQQARTDFYSELLRAGGLMQEGVSALKGSEIASAYPAGWVRQQSDQD